MLSLSLLLTFIGTLSWYATSKYAPAFITGLFVKLPMGNKAKTAIGWALIGVASLLLCREFDVATGLIVSSFVIALGLSYWLLMKPWPKQAVLLVALGFCLCLTLETVVANAGQ